MAQLKFNVDDELAKKFRQAVLAKRGKLAVSREGEEALKLYLKKNSKGKKINKSSRGTQHHDPIVRLIGITRSRGRPNALEDLKRMEKEID